MKKFENWLKKYGINMSNIRIETSEHNERKVVSINPIKTGEDVMLIPKKLIITSLKIEKTQTGRHILKLFEKDTELTKAIINITTYILFCSVDYIGYTKFWDPYLEILPKDLGHIPLFWNKQNLSYLKGSHLLANIRDRLKKIRNEYNILKKNIKDFNLFTFHMYKHVRCLVSSRNFRLNINGNYCSSMVPLADMLNHSNHAMTRWFYNNKLTSYQMVSKRSISSGIEITDSYGSKENHKYFMYYGFLLEDADTRIFIKTRKYSGEFSDNFNSDSMKNLLNYLRRLFLEKEEKFKLGFLSVYNEKKVMRDLINILKRKKRGYNHSVSYYKKNKIGGSLNKQNAYTLLEKELVIVETLLRKAQTVLSHLLGEKVEIINDDVKNYLSNVH